MEPKDLMAHAGPVRESELERIRAVPALSAFVDTVENILAEGDEDAFWRCEPAFRALSTSGFERDLTGYELGRMATVRGYIPPGSTSVKLTIVRRPEYRLLLILVRPNDVPEPKYSTMPEHRMMSVLGPGTVSAHLYVQPPGLRNEVFDPQARLVPNGKVKLGPGDMVKFRAGHDVIGASNCDAPAMTVLFVSDVRRSLLWEYDPATSLPTRALAAETGSSRLQYTARLLAAVGGNSSLPGLRRLLEHKDHFVRWTALRSIMALDPEEGTARVREAVNDPHPHVRNAATRSLAKLAQMAASPAVAAATE